MAPLFPFETRIPKAPGKHIRFLNNDSGVPCPYCYNNNVVPVLNKAPCHEDVWGYGGTVPRILNLGIRWK